MRNCLLSLIAMTSMLVGVSAAAQQPSQSGVRAQATASAQIISGESVRFDDLIQQVALKQNTNGKSRHIFPLARTRGEVVLDGRPLVLVTEFH